MQINGYHSKAEALRALNDALEALGEDRVSGFLAKPEDNPKLRKNGNVGVLSAPLHLAPEKSSGFQVCPGASLGCIKACLNTAGNPAYLSGKLKARRARTRALFLARKEAMAVIAFEIEALSRKAWDRQMIPAVRLDATSEFQWEKRPLETHVRFDNLMDAFPEVEFYDYCKVFKRMRAFCLGEMPSNYHLTFSRSEDNDAECAEVIRLDGTVAAVVSADVKKLLLNGEYRLPFGDREITPVGYIDGDETDWRPDDKWGHVVLLKEKGDARKDDSGFVIREVWAHNE